MADAASAASSIILTGQVLAGHRPEDVAVSLAQLLKTSREGALALLGGRETVVKREVPAAQVERYLQALGRIGAAARCEPAAPQELALVEETVSCPGCGHQQPKRTLCLGCGCDMPRVRAAQEQAAAEAKAAKVAKVANVADLAGPAGPYRPPSAALADRRSDAGTATPAIYGLFTAGRIGRLRLLAYGLAVTAPIVILGLLTGLTNPTASLGGMAVMGGLGLVCGWMGLRLMVLRLHDVNRSGKWILLLILISGLGGALQQQGVVLAASAVIWLGTLALVFWPGTDGENDYGPPSGPNSTPVTVAAFLAVAVQVLIVISAPSALRSAQKAAVKSASADRPAAGKASFTGWWQSSRAAEPILIGDDGRWRTRGSAGVRQEGTWRVENGVMIWTQDEQSGQMDINRVLSVKADEFRVMEMNGTITVFRRLDDAVGDGASR